MITVEADIFIDAPLDIVFDSALDLDVHTQCETRTHERVVGGQLHGKLRLGESVTFEGVHFGIKQRLTSKIITLSRPHMFIDQMQRGAFHFLRHTHTFTESQTGTVMHDRLDIAAPFGPIGWIAERLFLGDHMQRFLDNHQREFKGIVEGLSTN